MSTKRTTESVWAGKRHLAQTPWEIYRRNPTIAQRNRLTTQNDNLAKEIAHRWKDQCGVPFEDLLQVSRIGLIKAVERFDPSKGAAFSSFAVPYIQGEIQHFLRDYSWDLVKVSRRQIELASKIRRVHRQVANLGRLDADETKVAAAFGVSAHKWRQTAEAVGRKAVVELDDALHLTTHEGDRASQERQWQQVRQAVATLPNPYRSCLTCKFFSQLGDEAIARRQCASVAQVQSWIEEGLTRLRNGHLVKNSEVG